MKKFSAMFAATVLVLLMVSGIHVSAQAAKRYDPQTEGILSEYYPVKDGYISGILPGTSLSEVVGTCVPANITATGDAVATGTVLTAGGHSLTAIVTGDLNGDGKLTITDMLMLKSAVLGETLSQAEALAGDLNGDGKVSVTDFLRAKACLLGLEKPEYTHTAQNLIVLTPGTDGRWRFEASDVSGYESSDTSLVTVDNDGNLTALREGSAFVYALDAEGNVLARQMVTVLKKALTISVNSPSVRLVPGQSTQLTLSFNHPLSPKVTWVSSDSSIVTVADGLLTAKNLGSATVTATLDGGQQATVSVTVASPVTSLQIERDLYKVKPKNTKKPLVQLQPAGSTEEILWSVSDPSIATVSADGTVTGIKNGTVTLTATGKYSGKKDTCQVKVCNVQQVALTFDDGPGPRTDDLLDFLKENDIRVTFFVVGNRMNSYREEIQRQAAEGHEIGYHSYDHAIQTSLTSQRVTADFEKSDNLLYEMTGQHFTVWRSPGGGYNDRVLSCIPLPHIMWYEDTQDWKTLNTYSVYRAIMNTANDGDIILMHDIHGSTVNGAIQAMKELNAGDYEFVTVTELLSRKGTPPENGKTYFGDK